MEDFILIGSATLGFAWAIYCQVKKINNFIYFLGLCGLLWFVIRFTL